MKAPVVQQLIAGGTYAIALVACGVFAAGAGHGSYLVLMIASSPVGILGMYAGLAAVPAIFGPFLLWPSILLLLARTRERRHRPTFVTVMVVHYFGIAALPLTTWFRDDWRTVQRHLPELVVFLAVGLVVYVTGQVLIWRSLARLSVTATAVRW